MSSSMSPTPRLIIIGGGFGGMSAAKALKSWPGQVLVIDKTNHHLFQPLLYQVATGMLSPRDIAIPIREELRSQKNVTVLMTEVVAIDKEKHLIHLASGDVENYDYLIVATGSRHSYFNHPEWEPLAPGLKTVADAFFVREKILLSFEKAELCKDEKQAESYLNFVIIGGGPTGVEVAGAIAEIAFDALTKEFHRIDLKKTKILLIEAGPRILSAYPEKLSSKAKADLARLGIEVKTGVRVLNILPEGVEVEGGMIPSRCVLWCAGNQASPLLKTLHLELDRQGRVPVLPDLSLPGHPEIFVIGDAAACPMKEGSLLPGIAPVASQQGRYVAKLIRKALPSSSRKPFSYFDKGMMATIGKRRAVCKIGPFSLSGWLAWAAWAFVHVAYLVNFRSRLVVMIEWAFYYFKGQKGARIITGNLDKISKPPSPSSP